MLKSIEEKLFEIELDEQPPNIEIQVWEEGFLQQQYKFEYHFGKWRIITI